MHVVMTGESAVQRILLVLREVGMTEGELAAAAAAGTIKAFDASGCTASPCTPLWDGDTNTFSPVSGGPVAAGGHVHVGSVHGHLVAFGLPD